MEVRLDIHDGLVKGCKFYGDFFSRENFEGMEECFIGIRYQKDEIWKILNDFQNDDSIMRISTEQILDTMLDLLYFDNQGILYQMP